MRGLCFARLGAALLAIGCLEGQRADQGADADLRVEGASFFRGEYPIDSGGPPVLGAFLTQTTFSVGTQDKSFTGVLGPGATAAAVALEGDRGYWLVNAGPAPPETPGAPSFDAPLSFSADVLAGPHVLLVWAADGAGRFGSGSRSPFTLSHSALPEGRLVVSLFWDTMSDLDLHLITPDGSEVFSGDKNSFRPPLPGQQTDPDAWKTGGILDFDSNAQCDLDGRRNENVVFTATPPSGRYLVRVDTFSLCGESAARYGVEARLDGFSVAAARGATFGDATRYPHGRGAGVLALEFDVP